MKVDRILLTAWLASLSLVPFVRGCNEDAATQCLQPLSGYETFDWNAASNTARQEACALHSNVLECVKPNLDDCTNPSASLVTRRDQARIDYNAHCGAVQLLLSWPLYFTVFAAFFTQYYNGLF